MTSLWYSCNVILFADVIINGGYDSRTIFNDVWMLHLPTMKWTELIVTMPVPLYFHSTSVTNVRCFLINKYLINYIKWLLLSDEDMFTDYVIYKINVITPVWVHVHVWWSC